MKTTTAKAIAQALIDLGVEVVTHVPGYGGTETFQAFNELSMKNNKYSFHEEAAFTIAHSASICGKRSASLMKSHGLMKAANSVIDALYTEINAGFVTIIFEDRSGKHSDSILEIVPILQGLPLNFIQSSTATIYNDVIKAYHESEKRKSPVALLVDSLEVKNETSFEQKSNLKKTFTYKRDVYQHIIHPMLSDYQYKVFLAKKFEGDVTSIQRPTLPIVPIDFPDRAKSTAVKYAPLFDVFKNYRGDIVTGDTSGLSSFAFPPYDCVDIVTYMGGSIPLAIGAYLSGFKNVWALSGDFGFISAGMIGLIELLQREIPIKVLLFYNKQAAATGGQPINKKILRHMLGGFENCLLHIANPLDPFEVQNVLRNAAGSNEFKLIIADYPV
ncbi:MAG: thiamine pyrophosphate-dependent enzyme [Melioribacteraceae bacterium]|nr:thiamine pyrophosphate-dependent enzyme [Melioribacteraceae bacterium]